MYMRRLVLLVAALVAAAAVSAGFATSAGAYGGGASHDTWQVGLSVNCDNPTLCAGQEGGFWGWAEFDRWGNGSITGDVQGAGCAHTTGGGGAGAGHESVDIYAAHIGDNGDFIIDNASNPDFLGDSGIPAAAGHYMNHDAPGITEVINVSYRAAR
jgi:hypothetical protein